MSSDAEPLSEPRSISKSTFGYLVFVTIILLGVGEMVAVVAVSRALGFRLMGWWFGGLYGLNPILATVVVDGGLKRFGLSRSGKTREVQGRSTAFVEADGEVADDEVVEVRTPRSFLATLGVTCLGLSLVVSLLVAFVTHERMEVWAYIALAFFGLSGLYLIYEARWGKPQAWADASGLTGYSLRNQFWRKFTPWSAVATCEIRTYYDTFGKPFVIHPILKGFDGKELMTLNFAYTKVEDQERLVKYIKAKLPKPMVDPSEFDPVNWM